MSDPVDGTGTATADVCVTGDVIREVSIYQGDRLHPSQRSEGGFAPLVTDSLGGAHLLFRILEASLPDKSIAFGLEVKVEDMPSDLTAHVLYRPSAGGEVKDREKKPKEMPPAVWRVAQPLGYGLLPPPDAPEIGIVAKSCRSRVVAIDDGALGFRCVRAGNRWPLALKGPERSFLPDWIVLKMSAPVAQGDLWRALQEPSLASRLVVIVSADEMRLDGAALSRGLSWEQTVSELCMELVGNPAFSGLLRCRHLVVNFRREGALWIDNDPGGRTASLVFDSSLAEGEWKRGLADSESRVYGHLAVFAASVVAEVATGSPPDFHRAIVRGLNASRLLRQLGHGQVGRTPAFPLHPVAREATCPSPCDRYGKVAVPCPLSPGGCQSSWTIASRSENPDNPNHPLFGLAHQVAIYGEARLKHVPQARFGDLLAIDREEMSTLRGLRLMLQSYEKENPQKAPLCLGAFGPPGAGKSFGIKQIAKEILTKDVPILEFNLSQFSGPGDLIGAFHQVRDKVLEGRTPVVFWDEFDTKRYEWLQYLLAPMQDGKFQSGQLTHSIGKCIFVFAGGTSHDFEHFGPLPEPETDDDRRDREIRHEDARQRQDDESRLAEFIFKKGPDFISRLSAHMNVLGPNQRRSFNFATGAWDRLDPADVTFPVRRALLIRSMLGVGPAEELSIDRDLLNALLLVPRYRHGVRSLEKIVRPMRGARPPFRWSHLPPPQVLHEHLDSPVAFDDLCSAARTFQAPDMLRRIAAAIHENYQRLVATQENRSRAPLTVSEVLSAFDAMGDWSKATNLAAAARLPHVLAMAGLRLVEGAASPTEVAVTRAHLKVHLGTLSIEEHNLWCAFHRINDWRYLSADMMGGKRKDEDARRHSLLCPFEALKDDQKEKDHDTIRHYPEMVGLVGVKISFMSVS